MCIRDSSPGRLLQVTLVTSGTMTNRIDRLEAKGLVDKDVDIELYRFTRRNQWATTIVFWATIPVALFIGGDVAMWCWFALFPVNAVVGWYSNRSSLPVE